MSLGLERRRCYVGHLDGHQFLLERLPAVGYLVATASHLPFISNGARCCLQKEEPARRPALRTDDASTLASLFRSAGLRAGSFRSGTSVDHPVTAARRRWP